MTKEDILKRYPLLFHNARRRVFYGCFLLVTLDSKQVSMNKEVQYIITTLQESLDGEPWYGRPFISHIDEVDPTTVFVNPDEKRPCPH